MNTQTIKVTRCHLDTETSIYPFTFAELFTDSTQDEGGIRLDTSGAGSGSFGVEMMPSYVKPTNLLLEGLKALGLPTELSPNEHYWSVIKKEGRYYLYLPYFSPRQSGALCLLDL